MIKRGLHKYPEPEKTVRRVLSLSERPGAPERQAARTLTVSIRFIIAMIMGGHKNCFFPVQLCGKSSFYRYFRAHKGQERKPDRVFVTALILFAVALSSCGSAIRNRKKVSCSRKLYSAKPCIQAVNGLNGNSSYRRARWRIKKQSPCLSRHLMTVTLIRISHAGSAQFDQQDISAKLSYIALNDRDDNAPAAWLR